jgi:hypothetical protein
VATAAAATTRVAASATAARVAATAAEACSVAAAMPAGSSAPVQTAAVEVMTAIVAMVVTAADQNVSIIRAVTTVIIAGVRSITVIKSTGVNTARATAGEKRNPTQQSGQTKSKDIFLHVGNLCSRGTRPYCGTWNCARLRKSAFSAGLNSVIKTRTV